MSKTISLVSGAIAATMLVACSEPSPPSTVEPDAQVEDAAAQTYSAEAFFQTTNYRMASSSGYSFSADGSALLVSSDESGVFNAYRLPLDGSPAVALTESEDNAVFALSWFPGDDRVLYTYDAGGNELNHVVVRELDGTYHDLTPGDSLKAQFLDWGANGQSFYLLTTERNQRNFDVYRYASDGYARELVYENPGFQVGDISGDGRWLALRKPRTSADADIYVVDLHSDDREAVLVTGHEGNVNHIVFEIQPDNTSLVYGTDEHGEWREAWKVNLETGDRERFISADWDVIYAGSSKSGRYSFWGINADATTEVTIHDTETGSAVQLPPLPKGEWRNVRFSTDESYLALIVNADNSPSNVHVVDLVEGNTRKLTEALNPEIDPAHLVVSEVIRYKSFDGLEIPSILYKPHGASAANPVPGLVLVHGGPGGQTRTGYRAMVQHLVNHGYAVLGANNRGSSGYGKTFYHMDDKRHGEEDLLDIVHGRKYLESLDWIDGEKVGVIGGSYGGYMTAAALAFHPEVFDVGIDIFGVTNWVRTLESIPPWWEAQKESLYDEMGDPATDAERHRRISPLFHASNIVKPTLVIQGANDPRVLQVESDELVAAIQANEVPVEYIVFPDEGHGFRKRINQVTASNAYVRFLDTYLKGE